MFTIGRLVATVLALSVLGSLPTALANDGAAASGVTIIVSPTGDDRGAGTPAEPVATIRVAAKRATPGTRILLRGGTYRNAEWGTPFPGRRQGSLARITTSGTADAPIVLRPYDGETVRLRSDVSGLALRNADHWRIQDIELIGSSRRLDRDRAIELWWATDETAMETSGRGIALADSDDVVIRNVVVRQFPGAGISNNGGADVKILDSVIVDNAWWSTAGTHGIANSAPASTDPNATIVIRGNLVAGNQSSIISHVFSKGVVKLAIDEGNGIHMQNNAELFAGTFIAERNLAILNGKAGLGLNTVDGSVIRNNAFYDNARAVAGSGELSIQSSDSRRIRGNLFDPNGSHATIRDFQDAYAGVSRNWTVASPFDDDLPRAVRSVRAVFRNPSALDFRRAADIPSGAGVPTADLDRMFATVAAHGLTIDRAPTKVDTAYLEAMRADIIASWPAPAPGDGIPDDLVLADPDSGFCYRYETRLSYPDEPPVQAEC